MSVIYLKGSRGIARNARIAKIAEMALATKSLPQIHADER
jgi:hypothetical protein